jgi:hypothetical protein
MNTNKPHGYGMAAGQFLDYVLGRSRVRTSMRLAATRGMGIGAAHVLTGLRRSEP